MLSSWNIGFDAIDTEAQPDALQDLERFGIPRVPAVVLGDRAVHGWNPKGVAELVGASYDETEQLPPAELARRLDLILDAAQRVIRQIPPEHLSMKTPGRDRTVHQLGYHIFRVARAYPDAMQEGYLPEAWFAEQPPEEINDSAAIAHYGQTVRDGLTAWLQQPAAVEGMVETYYGPQTAPAFFERTVWHAAQHLRQFYALLDLMAITPEDPLTEADFKGLPMPQKVW